VESNRAPKEEDYVSIKGGYIEKTPLVEAEGVKKSVRYIEKISSDCSTPSEEMVQKVSERG